MPVSDQLLDLVPPLSVRADRDSESDLAIVRVLPARHPFARDRDDNARQQLRAGWPALCMVSGE